jgi:N-acyl-D-aspartate/D-glutamate deacylase
MLDVLLRGGTVVDGTGGAGFRSDVGIQDGRVVSVGAVEESAVRTVDVTGLVVAPGVIDPHTHYDAQLLWDPLATPSNGHGVTTVISGNCGFTLAPLRAPEADYIRRMMAVVEGMPLSALEDALDWDWQSFGDYLSRMDGGLAVNAGFLVGHCAVRRAIMGADAVGGRPTADQLAAMQELLAESLQAGGLGLSSSQSYSHDDADGRPVPSRHADADELLALCQVVRRYPGTSLEFITDGCINWLSDDEIERMALMSYTARRPLNWNVLAVDSSEPDRVPHQLRASNRAAEVGGRVVALTMPTGMGMNLGFSTFCALWLLPGWKDVLGKPAPERLQALLDPDVRRAMDEGAHSIKSGPFVLLANWGDYRIGDTEAPENARLEGRYVRDIAAERRTSNFDTLLDIVAADRLETVLWPPPVADDAESWEMRGKLWEDPRVLLGGSDAGAHLDRICASVYPTAFLADCLRGRRLVPMETAVRLITSAPADLFGLRDRGRVVPGAIADLMVFDPETVGAGPIRMALDLPGENKRLVADALGVEHVFVAGTETLTAGRATGALPGGVLRSGRDTVTSVVPAGV